MTGQNRQGPIQILDEAVQLLCRTASSSLTAYYIGSMPFILGLLYFIGDMSRNSFAAGYCAIASLGLALLYVWMKCWQARFAALVLASLADRAVSPPSPQTLYTVIARQAFIQASGFLVLPLAALLVLPYGWCYAFYQNVTVFGLDAQATCMGDCRRAWQQALLWPRQNHLALSIMTLFGLVVYTNIVLTVFMLPYAVKRFAGIETVFTLTGAGVFNTTFLAVTMGLAYLCLDPILKTVYVLRCYHGEAIKTGTDLKARLTQIKRLAALAGAGCVLTLACLSAGPVDAAAKAKASGQAAITGAAVSAEELDRSIESVLQQREFAWRMPRQSNESLTEDESGPIASALQWVVDKLADVGRWIWHQLERFAKWINKTMPDRPAHKSDRSSGPLISARTLLTMLLILAAGAAIVFVIKTWKRSQSSDSDASETNITFEPDLTDESLKADSLPVQEWLDMALKMHQKGSFRLAIRALYLATLSYLADKEFISIQIYKSNREYLRELSRRAVDQPDMTRRFEKMVTVFERIWYGTYRASEQDFHAYAAIQQHLTGGGHAG